MIKKSFFLNEIPAFLLLHHHPSDCCCSTVSAQWMYTRETGFLLGFVEYKHFTSKKNKDLWNYSESSSRGNDIMQNECPQLSHCHDIPFGQFTNQKNVCQKHFLRKCQCSFFSYNLKFKLVSCAITLQFSLS
jgi:hypothetical protein